MSYRKLGIALTLGAILNLSVNATGTTKTSKKSSPTAKPVQKSKATSYALPSAISEINQIKYKDAKTCLEGFGQRVDNLYRTSAHLLNISLLRMITDDYLKKIKDKSTPPDQLEDLQKAYEKLNATLNQEINDLAPNKQDSNKYVLDNENVRLLRGILTNFKQSENVPKETKYESPNKEIFTERAKELHAFCSVKSEYYKFQYELVDTANCEKASGKKVDNKNDGRYANMTKNEIFQEVDSILSEAIDPIILKRLNSVGGLDALKKKEDIEKKLKEVLSNSNLLESIAGTLQHRLFSEVEKNKRLYTPLCRETIMKGDAEIVKAVVCERQVALPSLPEFIEQIKKATNLEAPRTEAAVPPAPPVPPVTVVTPEEKPADPSPVPAPITLPPAKARTIEFELICESEKEKPSIAICKPEGELKTETGDYISWFKVDATCDKKIENGPMKNEDKKEIKLERKKEEAFFVCMVIKDKDGKEIGSSAKEIEHFKGEKKEKDKKDSERDYPLPKIQSQSGGVQPPSFPPLPSSSFVIGGGNSF